MKVSDLIAKLSKLPPDADVYYPSGDYKDDWQQLSKVDFESTDGWGKLRGAYLE